MPKITEILNNEAFSFISGSDTVFMGYKYIIDNAENGYLADGKLFVNAAAGEKVTVYNLSGQKLYETVANGEVVIDNMPLNELIIVKTGRETVKVSIR